jgi:hypothetical protein
MSPGYPGDRPGDYSPGPGNLGTPGPVIGGSDSCAGGCLVVFLFFLLVALANYFPNATANILYWTFIVLFNVLYWPFLAFYWVTTHIFVAIFNVLSWTFHAIFSILHWIASVASVARMSAAICGVWLVH